MSPHRQLTSNNTNTEIKIKTKLDDFDIKLSKAHICLVKANLQRGKASTCPDFRVEIPHSYILTQMITQFTFICDFFLFFSHKNAIKPIIKQLFTTQKQATKSTENTTKGKENIDKIKKLILKISHYIQNLKAIPDAHNNFLQHLPGLSSCLFRNLPQAPPFQQ